MKKIFTILIVFAALMVTSCSPNSVARISYKELPHKYKDIKINKEIIINGDHVYITSIRGAKHKIDTKVYNVEINKD
jgi:hypothetical protein